MFVVRYSQVLGTNVSCDSCSAALTQQPMWYRCRHCIEVDLCVTCFTKGASLPADGHDNLHKMSVIQWVVVYSFPLCLLWPLPLSFHPSPLSSLPNPLTTVPPLPFFPTLSQLWLACNIKSLTTFHSPVSCRHRIFNTVCCQEAAGRLFGLVLLSPCGNDWRKRLNKQTEMLLSITQSKTHAKPPQRLPPSIQC